MLIFNVFFILKTSGCGKAPFFRHATNRAIINHAVSAHACRVRLCGRITVAADPAPASLRGPIKEAIDGFNETSGVRDENAGLLDRHHGKLADRIVGELLEAVGIGQKRHQLTPGARIARQQAGQFGAHARMGFGDLARLVEDQGLCGVKGGIVGGARGGLGEADSRNLFSFVEALERPLNIMRVFGLTPRRPLAALLP